MDIDRDAASPEAVEEHYGELILALSSSPDVSANHMRQFRLMIEAVRAEEREKTETITAEKEKWRKRCAEETLAWAEATKRADALESALSAAPVEGEVEWEWGLLNPEHCLGEAHLYGNNREHIEKQWRRGHPSIKFVRRRKAGPWEEVTNR